MFEEATSDHWNEVESDAVAEWENEEQDITIEVTEYDRELILSVYRTVSSDGYRADIQTLRMRLRTIEETVARIGDIVEEIDTGIGDVTAVKAEPVEYGGDTVVHFYCVFEDLLPSGLDPEDIQFEGDLNDEELEQTQRVMSSYETDEEASIGIEIYPVHEINVTEVDE